MKQFFRLLQKHFGGRGLALLFITKAFSHPAAHICVSVYSLTAKFEHKDNYLPATPQSKVTKRPVNIMPGGKAATWVESLDIRVNHHKREVC